MDFVVTVDACWLRIQIGSMGSVQKVLLFGKTGEGKSTLANMLVSGSLENPLFNIGSGLEGVTSKVEHPKTIIPPKTNTLGSCMIDTY